MKNNFIKKLTLIALFTTILFVQQIALASFINVQLTFLLILLYSKILDFKSNLIIIFSHTMLVAILLGGLLLSPFTFLAYSAVLAIFKLFGKVEKAWVLGIIAGFAGLVLSWIYVIPSVLLFEMDLGMYLVADIIPQITLFIVNFMTVSILYKPLMKITESQIEIPF